MDHKQWKTRGGGMAVLCLLLACFLMMNGCESDSVAPDEELPKMTEEDAAQQAALVAVSVARVSPHLLNFNGSKPRDKDLGVYLYLFPSGGDLSGSIMLEYFDGGPTGTHCHWDDADYGLLYTQEGEMVSATIDLGGGLGPIFAVSFNLYGDIDQVADTATVSGSGTFVTGDTPSDFTLTDVLVEAVSTYPDGGVLTFLTTLYEVVVTYDGSSTGAIAIDGNLLFTVDIDTGIISPVEE